ncbi:hypothetical protein P5W98_07445 [Paraburkholderia sp. A1BS-2L]|uniref:IS66 family insertion sequence element accessory protein TnpA n=1 Tax=Paraburkholderia sp. A1BS-2L TaxID=3028373 RepID=UPI003DA9D879
MKAAAKREEVELAWRQRLARFAECGQTVRAFCREESVSEFRFYHWRRRLQRPASPRGAEVLTGGSAFVDLGTIAAADTSVEPGTPAGQANLTIRLDLPGGIVLTIARS